MKGRLGLAAVRGFTLVELLVVITIVAILSVLAVNGYMTYRRTALLSLATDDVISQIELARQKTVFGIGFEEEEDAGAGARLVGGDGTGDSVDSGTASARCYGISFQKEGDVFAAKTFWQMFNGKKVWKGAGFVYEGCTGVQQDLTPMVLDGAVKITNVGSFEGNFEDYDGSTTDLSELVIRFVPPKGEIEISIGGAAFASNFDGSSGMSGLKFVLQFGEGAQSAERGFIYNLVSLKAKHVQESS